MEIRRPLGLFMAIGWLGWPVGYFALGGFDNDVGASVIGGGCVILLATMAAELLLRARDGHRS